MKLRSGFVSNSSSSSFIVGIPKMPTSPQSLEKMMFGKPGVIELYDSYKATTLEIATRVYDDITTGKAKKLTKRSIVKELMGEPFPGSPPYSFEDHESDKISDAYFEQTGKRIYDDAADPIIRKIWDKAVAEENKERENKEKIAVKAFVGGFWPRVAGSKVYSFTYADDNGEVLLEHGGIFDKLPHIRLSHH